MKTIEQQTAAQIDPETDRCTVQHPAHCIVGGNVYWLEPLNGGAPYLMTCPVLAGGAIGWSDAAEVGPGECAGYAEIVATLTPAQ